jgi:hypothetical protein
MVNSILSWSAIIGLVLGPFLLGALIEQKLEWAKREVGSRLLRRY